MTPASWLVDNSVLARLDVPEVLEVMLPRIQAGEVGVALVTELEIGYSARSPADYQVTRDDLVDHLIPVLMPTRAEQVARELQADLVSAGQHRGVSIPDLIVAVTARVEGLTVLHYDSDFDVIAEFTGQPTEWVVPRGTVR